MRLTSLLFTLSAALFLTQCSTTDSSGVVANPPDVPVALQREEARELKKPAPIVKDEDSPIGQLEVQRGGVGVTPVRF